MKINLSINDQTLLLLENPIPTESELLPYCYDNSEVAIIAKRELKKQYKDFRMYIEANGMKASGSELYPTNFYVTDVNLFQQAASTLKEMRKINKSLLFELHNAIFGSKFQGDIISQKRKESGYTQKHFAKMLNMSPMTISLIENGEVFNATSIKKICDYLKIDFRFPRDVQLFERRK